MIALYLSLMDDDSHLMAVYHLIIFSVFLLKKRYARNKQSRFLLHNFAFETRAELIEQTYATRCRSFIDSPGRRVNYPAAITDFVRRGRKRPRRRPRGWRWAKKKYMHIVT